MNPALAAPVRDPQPLSAAPAEPASARESQWTLMRRRFRRHRLAVAGLLVLVVLYGVAVLAEFVAPYPAHWRELRYAHCPPQPLKFSWEHGMHVLGMKREVDPVTLRRSYREDPSLIIPVRLFPRGEPTLLWGAVPIERRLLGVDSRHVARASTADFVPTFFFLGADKYGQDVFSRLIFGARISLSVGMVAVVATFLLGITIGGISGYLGGRIDTFLQRGIEIVNSFPNLPLWLALGAILPPEWSPLTTYFAITIVLSLLNWTNLARVVRGKILSLREEDYAVAARLLGASHARILFRHLLPGFASHIIVVLTLSVPTMILGETALSFLGLGLRAPIVSWGVLLQDCLSVQTVSSYPWLLAPVLLIVLTVLSFNFLGDGLRDAADPYDSR